METNILRRFRLQQSLSHLLHWHNKSGQWGKTTLISALFSCHHIIEIILRLLWCFWGWYQHSVCSLALLSWWQMAPCRQLSTGRRWGSSPAEECSFSFYPDFLAYYNTYFYKKKGGRWSSKWSSIHKNPDYGINDLNCSTATFQVK